MVDLDLVTLAVWVISVSFSITDGTAFALSWDGSELGSEIESAMLSKPKSIGWAELRFFAMDIVLRNEFMTLKNPGRSIRRSR